jgi:hypothetical protein
MVSARGLGSHQRSKGCEAGTFAARMRLERGWTLPGFDVRQYGIPGEHGPSGDTQSSYGRRRGVYAVWHPAWVADVGEAMRAAGVFGQRQFVGGERAARIWQKARDDAEWRDALCSVGRLGGEEALKAMIEAVLKAPPEGETKFVPNPLTRRST